MEENSLPIAFGDSLEEETVACISEYAELGLDAIERSWSTRLAPKE